jgi:hypothetical protein
MFAGKQSQCWAKWLASEVFWNVYKSDERNDSPRWWLHSRDFSRVRGCEENQKCCFFLFSEVGKTDREVEFSLIWVKANGRAGLHHSGGAESLGPRCSPRSGLWVNPREGGWWPPALWRSLGLPRNSVLPAVFTIHLSLQYDDGPMFVLCLRYSQDTGGGKMNLGHLAGSWNWSWSVFMQNCTNTVRLGV